MPRKLRRMGRLVVVHVRLFVAECSILRQKKQLALTAGRLADARIAARRLREQMAAIGSERMGDDVDIRALCSGSAKDPRPARARRLSVPRLIVPLQIPMFLLKKRG